MCCNIIENSSSDLEFKKMLMRRITRACSLPLTIPDQELNDIIKLSALWFYDNSDDAVEERYYLISYTDIVKFDNLNKLVKLPKAIESVYGVNKTNQGYNRGNYTDFNLNKIVYSNSYLNNFSSGSTVTDYVIALSEISTLRDTFQYPISYSYNQNTNILNLQGEYSDHDLILECFTRIDLCDLYEDQLFIKYCIGQSLLSLTFILNTYDFNLPGGIKINSDQFQSQGEKMISDVEEDLKNRNSSGSLIFQSSTV